MFRVGDRVKTLPAASNTDAANALYAGREAIVTAIRPTPSGLSIQYEVEFVEPFFYLGYEFKSTCYYDFDNALELIEHMNKFGLSEKRYEQMRAYGNSDKTIEALIRLHGFDNVERGYYRTCVPGSFSTVVGAVSVVTEPPFGAFADNWEACRQAEKDGVKFINDMPGLEKGFYVDTPVNRQICEIEISRYPEKRIENWIDIDDGEWGTRYAEHFGVPKPFEVGPDQTLILRTELPDRVEVGCYSDQVMPEGTPDWMLDKMDCGLLVLPRDWVEEHAKSIGYADLDEFFSEYTYDDTMYWFSDAIQDGVLLGFSTGAMPCTEQKVILPRQPSLDEQMSRAKQTAERSANTPTKTPEHERS